MSNPEKIKVDANKSYTDTGIDLHKGDELVLSATGKVSYSQGGTDSGPNGGKTWPDMSKFAFGDAAPMSLVANIGSKESLVVNFREGIKVLNPNGAFEVGSENTHTVVEDGRLFFAVNDWKDGYANNRGSFEITVKVNRASDFPIDNGFEFQVGQYYYASGKGYLLVFQTDGNFVVYKTPSTPIWAINTQTKGRWRNNKRAVFQSDGNLVTYDAQGKGIWHTDTAGHPSAQLHLDPDNGRLYITDQGKTIWFSN